MRALTIDELELVIGAGEKTATLTPVIVTGHAPAPPPAPVPTPPPAPTPFPGPPPPPCPPPMPPQRRDDQNYVYSNEGTTLSTTGYTLPPAQFPKSGVTIGYGVDLGQQNANQLTSWGISPAGLSAVSPYLGLQGQSAVNYVNANGAPTISSADATAISNGAYNSIVSAAESRFNNGSIVSFDSLPSSAQTVIADIAYNAGSNGAPAFFTDAMAGNWSAAIYELNNFYAPGNSNSRHRNDANLLQQSINSGELALDGTCLK